MTPSDILDRAATVIERNGWHQGEYARVVVNGPPARECPVCVLGAIDVAAGFTPGEGYDGVTMPAVQALAEHLGLSVLAEDLMPGADVGNGWNDHPDRTAEQVITALRAAANEARAAR